MRVSVLALIAVFFCLPLVIEAQTGFSQPEGLEVVTDEGTVALAWAATFDETESRVFEVRRWKEGGPGEGTLVYEGGDTATYVSGLDEGQYAFRVRSKPEAGTYPEWGDGSLSVKVEYIQWNLVVGLMTAGLVTFIVLLVSLFLGHRRSQSQR